MKGKRRYRAAIASFAAIVIMILVGAVFPEKQEAVDAFDN